MCLFCICLITNSLLSVTVELSWYCYNFTLCLVEVAFNLLIHSRCLHEVFMWKQYSAYCYQCFMQLKLFFSQVTFAKPKSSRNSSIGKPSLLKGEWVNMYLLYVCLFSYMTHVIFVALLIFWCCLFSIDNISCLMRSFLYDLIFMFVKQRHLQFARTTHLQRASKRKIYITCWRKWELLLGLMI